MVEDGTQSTSDFSEITQNAEAVPPPKLNILAPEESLERLEPEFDHLQTNYDSNNLAD